MDNTVSQNSLNYQYCYSSYSSSYSVSCSDCCCYSDSSSYFPYCCSCSYVTDDFWIVWLVISVIFVVIACVIVIVIQALRRKRQQGMQVPFLNNQFNPNNQFNNPNNANFNASNDVIIISSNNGQNPTSYQPPSVNGQYQQQNAQYQQGVNNPGYIQQQQQGTFVNGQQVGSNQGHSERHYRFENEHENRVGQVNVRL